MKKYTFLYLFLVTVFISCNSTEKQEKDVFKLKMEFKSPLNDKFKIYYTILPYKDIDGQYFIDKYTYGSAQFQKIEFEFPKDVVPYKIRLDVGENQNIENLIIKNISVSYNNNIINGDEGLFMNYWSPNECLQYDKENFIYKIIPSNGKKSPVFMSNITLEEEIKSLRPYLLW